MGIWGMAGGQRGWREGRDVGAEVTGGGGVAEASRRRGL